MSSVGGAGVGGPRALAQDDVDAVDAARPLDVALDDTEKRSCVPPSVKSGSPTARCSSRAFRGERREHVGVDALEEVELLEHLDHTAAARYSCTKCTAIEPSPTAEATRFIDSLRTSPATNTPGMLVSSR